MSFDVSTEQAKLYLVAVNAARDSVEVLARSFADEAGRSQWISPSCYAGYHSALRRLVQVVNCMEDLGESIAEALQLEEHGPRE